MRIKFERLWSLLIDIVVAYFCVSGESTDSADEVEGEEEEEEEEDGQVEDHLNLCLDEESSIVTEYRALILSAGYDTSSSTSKS